MSRPRILVTNDDGDLLGGDRAARGGAFGGRRRLHGGSRPGAQRRRPLPDAAPSAAGQAHRAAALVRGRHADGLRELGRAAPAARTLRPKLLFSGINLGLNLGDDVTYSGTVSAAFEGTLIGIPSVAISQEIETGFTFDAAAGFAARLAGMLLEQPLPPGTLINVNVPAGPPRGVRVGPAGEAPLRRGGHRENWIRGAGPTTGSARRRPKGELEQGTDLSAVAEKYISDDTAPPRPDAFRSLRSRLPRGNPRAARRC